ncbi:trypsin-like peptidase domain-containing protein [Novosphingobium sp.]|uniref:trypsin-like peptidase domain-containing protein n=1 Tax=Novosphingobium sp. TaxID=1874826 RepID=UPI0031D28CFD
MGAPDELAAAGAAPAVAKAKAVPIRTRNAAGAVAGGTGFFALYEGRLWLVTAAHVALGANGVHDRWAEWPDEIAVHVGPGMVSVLFDDQRQPLFAYKAEAGSVADILALDLSPVAEFDFMGSVEIYDLAAAAAVAVGEAITAHGFPTDVDDWPQAVVRGLSVVALSPGVIEHLLSTSNGMSGGPVLDERGALLGLVMGHNNGIGRIASVEAIRWIIDDSRPRLPVQEWRTDGAPPRA